MTKKIISGILASASLIAILATININFPKEPFINTAFGLNKKASLITVVFDNTNKTFYTSATTITEALNQGKIYLDEFDNVFPRRDFPLTGDKQTITIERAIPIVLDDDGATTTLMTANRKVSEVLSQFNIVLGEKDILSPSPNHQLAANDIIKIVRAKDITLLDGLEKKTYLTQANTVNELFDEISITLGEKDLVEPSRESTLTKQGEIKITRVSEREEKTEEAISFETIYQNDENILKGEQQLIQDGETGLLEKTYKLTLHNGEEIEKVLLNENLIREAKPTIIAVGVKEITVSSGDAREGLATYFYGPTIAASTVFPLGTTIKVTNLANGKSVIVTIDDTGSFGPDIVVDLRDDFFAQLASLSEGIIRIKAERVN